jgi:hypothetical protein
MPFDLGHFLTTNSSAVFALAGALGGGILSFVGSMLLKRREFNLSLSGKLLERRISAHENVLAAASELRVMMPLGGASGTGEMRRAPQVMSSREILENWLGRFTQLRLGDSWLSTETKREVNFVQDYLVTLHMYLEGVDSDAFPGLGEIIRQDFIDLSSSLEKNAFKFFEKGVRKLRPDSPEKWHKYELKETNRRLSITLLVKNHKAFSALRVTDNRDK